MNNVCDEHTTSDNRLCFAISVAACTVTCGTIDCCSVVRHVWACPARIFQLSQLCIKSGGKD